MMNGIVFVGRDGFSGLVTASAKARGKWQYTWMWHGEPAGDIVRADIRAVVHEALGVDRCSVVQVRGRLAREAVRQVASFLRDEAARRARFDAGDDEVDFPARPPWASPLQPSKQAPVRHFPRPRRPIMRARGCIR